MPYPARTIIIMTTTAAVVMGVAALVIPPPPTSSTVSTLQSNQTTLPEHPKAVAVPDHQPTTPATPLVETPASGFSFPASARPTAAKETTNLTPKSDNEDERLALLSSPDPAIRMQTLDLIWETADTLEDRQIYAEHVAKLSSDPDPAVAELATRLTALLQTDGVPTDDALLPPEELVALDETDPTLSGDWVEPPPSDEAEQAFSSDIATDPIAAGEPDAPANNAEQMDQLYDDILNNPDSQARYEAISRSVEMANSRTLEVLIQAVSDTEVNNRIAALEGLEQLLQQGIAKTEELTNTLQQSTSDPDERVATLATRILQAQNEPG